MEKMPDRRVLRTKNVLYSAFVKQVLLKGYDEVTVQDVIDEADVSRSTFYVHFTGKEDLLRMGFDRLRHQLLGEQAAKSTEGAEVGPFGFSLMLFEHARAHRDMYRAMVGGRGGLVAQRELRTVIGELVRQSIKDHALVEAVHREIVVQFLVGAFVSVLHAWLEGKPKLTLHEVDAAFQTLAAGGIRSITTAAVPDAAP